MKAKIGPEREETEVSPFEADGFILIVEAETRAPERLQLSYAVSVVSLPKGTFVVDAFQRNARKMWRTAVVSPDIDNG